MDEMRFFCGGKPAQQFERGTQIRRTYKCGSSGCKDRKMQDLAHSLQCKWWSLTELQSLVLSGKYGNSPGRLKPFDSLKIDELRQGLEARGYNTTGKLKQQMQEELDYPQRSSKSGHSTCFPPSAIARQPQSVMVRSFGLQATP